VFDENSYRTSRVNEAFLLITQTITQLQGYKKNATVSDGIFDDAPLIEKSSNLFKSDLLKINELKIMFDQWWQKRSRGNLKDPD
jgi:hypothetical protein